MQNNVIEKAITNFFCKIIKILFSYYSIFYEYFNFNKMFLNKNNQFAVTNF